MNVVFIVPTGLGCDIGGHAGDALPAANLIAQTCNKIILHPNVVNASDINEIPPNAIYVEGSILDRFLEGKIELQKTYSNKILVAVNPPLKPETINAVNASRSTLGINAEIVELKTPLIMEGWIENNIATGKASGVKELIKQVQKHSFDALAIASPIFTANEVALEYFNNNDCRTNPWGAIEAKVSRQVADAINKPVAHAPVEANATKNDDQLFYILYNKIVDRRKAAEAISNCYIHCILKGLHKAPRIGKGLTNNEVDCLITPTGCVGRPHIACFNNNIPVIAIKENTSATNQRDNRIIYVDNYLEAAGLISCIKAGIDPKFVRKGYNPNL